MVGSSILFPIDYKKTAKLLDKNSAVLDVYVFWIYTITKMGLLSNLW